MNQSELLILAAVVVSLSSLGVFAYLGKKHADTTALLVPIVQALIARTDAALIPYAAQLKPVNTAAQIAETLIDEPTDILVQSLPANVIEAMRVIVAHAETFTDGQPLEAVK